MNIAVGAVLRSYCDGAFGRSWESKMVEAVGADWLVCRGQETGRVYLLSLMDQGWSEAYLDQKLKIWGGECKMSTATERSVEESGVGRHE